MKKGIFAFFLKQSPSCPFLLMHPLTFILMIYSEWMGETEIKKNVRKSSFFLSFLYIFFLAQKYCQMFQSRFGFTPFFSFFDWFWWLYQFLDDENSRRI